MTLVLGIACEYGVFRPLRNASPLAKLVASLGILLTAQASIVLIYGTAGRDAPGLLPKDIVEVAGAAIPADRFWLTGIVIVIAALLWALYKYTRFGLATRAASESEANALLAGLSPNRLALLNTILATLVAGFVGILASSLAQLDSTTLTLQVVPALGAVLFARFTSFAITCFAGLAIGVVQSLIYYFSTQAWFPTDQGAALPGVSALVTFVIIVIALWWRGSSLPTRGEIVEQGLPEAPRPERLLRPTAIAVVVGVVALIVLPFDYRNALVITMAGIVICLSFVVITGYVGQVSLAQVALAGAAGFTVSHFADRPGDRLPARRDRRHRGRDDPRVHRRRLGVARARCVVGGGDVGGRGRHRAVRLREQHLRRGVDGLAGARADAVRVRSRRPQRLPRPGRQHPEPGARLLHPGRGRADGPVRRATAHQRTRSADARGPLERARGRGRGRERAQHEVRRVRHLVVHRRRRRRPVRLHARLGERRPVRHPHRARVRGVRLRRRHHDGVRCGVRRPDRVRGRCSRTSRRT